MRGSSLATRVVDQNRKQIGVRRCLRRDDDRQRMLVSAHRVFDGVVKFGNRPFHLAEFVVDREYRALPVSGRGFSRQRLVKRPARRAINLLYRVAYH
jgi:hypothetical protein